MIPELFRIGSFSVSPFGLMLVAALLAAYWQLQRGMRARGIGTEDDPSNIVFACGFFGIVGGKIYYAALVDDWGMLLDRAGIVWYGCLIGGALAFFAMARWRRLPVLPTLDAAGPGLALGYGVGRIGCLLVGDDYGVPTQLPWGMSFEHGLPPTTAGNLRREFNVDVDPSILDEELLRVHPTQIYSSLTSFAIFGVALWLEKRKLAPGGLFLAVMAMLSLERIFVEFFRAKDDRFFGQFTLAQLISVAILVLIGLMALLRRRTATA
jgi:phosphatidylglycerol:prolipoprotein diacylglycerol transferase